MSTPCGPPNRTLKAVLDSCVRKLATLPNPANKSAVIVELCLREVVQANVTPDMLGEYQRVLDDCPPRSLEKRNPPMTDERVLDLLAALESAGVLATVDGGWGVDALLERQTRPHEDLDLVVALGDVERICSALNTFGFSLSEDHLPVRFVLRNSTAEQLDFHTVTFDEQGGGVQPQPGGGSFRYPPEGFVRGVIGGKGVACISAQVQVLCHLGYAPTAKDAHDVLALCREFGLAVPAAYTSFHTSVREQSP